MEEKKEESTKTIVKKANLLYHNSLKHILDESVSDLFESFEMSYHLSVAGDGGEQPGSAAAGTSTPSSDKQKEKARVSRTSLILWHAHQNDSSAVRKLLEEDPSLVHARDYDKRTPLHVASLHGWTEVVKCLIEFGADVNAHDRWKNTPLADAEGARKLKMIELLRYHGGLSYVSFRLLVEVLVEDGSVKGQSFVNVDLIEEDI